MEELARVEQDFHERAAGGGPLHGAEQIQQGLRIGGEFGQRMFQRHVPHAAGGGVGLRIGGQERERRGAPLPVLDEVKVDATGQVDVRIELLDEGRDRTLVRGQFRARRGDHAIP